MTPVVVDASAGVEMVADSLRGRALSTLLPLLTDDGRLANVPTLTVPVLRPP